MTTAVMDKWGSGSTSRLSVKGGSLSWTHRPAKH